MNRRALSAISLFFAFGCVDPWQVGFMGVRKVFRVPVDAVSVAPPTADAEALLGSEGLSLVLRSAGMPEADIALIEASGASLSNLSEIDALVPLGDYVEDIEWALIGAMQTAVDDHARASLNGGDLVTSFESDWTAWEEWELDLSDPNGSIEAGLDQIPVAYRIIIEAQSVDELVGSEIDGLTDVEVLEAVFLREVGIRTLRPEEVQPDDGWPQIALANTAHKQLTDPSRVDHCAEGQPVLHRAIGASIDVRSLVDADRAAELARTEEVQSRSDCGVLVRSDDTVNLEPYFQGGFVMTVELSMTPGTTTYDLGGYIMPGVEGRFRIPGSILASAPLTPVEREGPPPLR